MLMVNASTPRKQSFTQLGCFMASYLAGSAGKHRLTFQRVLCMLTA